MMISILMIMLIFVMAFAIMLPKFFADDIRNRSFFDNEIYYVALFVLIAAAVRVICICNYSGHVFDTSCFRSWAERLANGRLSDFYSSNNFNDYPPGYMYVLWLAGKINTHFGLNDTAANIILKIPPIILDLISGIFIYKISRKSLSMNMSLAVMAAWLFNPAVIIDSSMWGQVDIAYTFVIALMMYFIAERKLIYSYFAFAVCIMLKPQAFFVGPILIYGIIEQVFLEGFDIKVFFKNLLFGVAAIGLMFLISAPFGVGYVFEQYKSTLHGSAFFTQNAFNIWGMMGKNYVDVTTTGIVVGYILLALSVAFSAVIFFNTKGRFKVYFSGAVLILCSYILSVKMNERYAFAAMMLFLMAYAEKPLIKNAVLYLIVTLIQFFNIAWVLFIFEQNADKYCQSNWICLYSAINVVAFTYIIYVALRNCRESSKNITATTDNYYM